MSQEPKTMKVVGFDPSLRNWGIAEGTLDTLGYLTVDRISVTQPLLPTGKQVRQNSKDLETAKQLTEAALEAAKGAKAIFVEVPVGSQSARAMASYGVCVGVLGALRATGIPFFEVTASEVKLIATKNKLATKADMIGWAKQLHPEANWPTYKEHGVEILSAAKAEHMADAIGAIYAGVNTNEFKQLLSMTN